MKYAIVVFGPDGTILAIEPYDFRNTLGRDERVRQAMNAVAQRLGIPAPEQLPRSRGVTDELGNQWGRSDATGLAVGMVETGFGTYGFEAKEGMQGE